MSLTRLTLTQFDDLDDKVHHAWLRLNAATDTYDALHAIMELRAVWQAIQAVAEILQQLDGQPQAAGASIPDVIARHHISLLRPQKAPALTIQQLLARATEIRQTTTLPRESIQDTPLIHDALPVLWRLVRSLHHEIRRRRPLAYYQRLLRNSARVLVVLGLCWLVYCALCFALPWGVLVTYYRGENFEHACGWHVANQLLEDDGNHRPLPWMPREHWSARWQGYLIVPQTATYDFFCQSDDGLRLWIDGELLVDNWRCQGWLQSGRHASRQLPAGRHTLRIEFFNRTEEAALRVRWSGGPVPPDTVIGWPYLRQY